MFLNIANFGFEIENSFDYIKKQTVGYEAPVIPTDYEFKITEKDILTEREYDSGDYSDEYLESIAAYRKIAEWLPLNGAFVLHSATFAVDGVGIAFAAHSGTGKTTHMRLWKQLLGEKFTVINGDKPIIRFLEDYPIAYGTPWNGKEHFGNNTSAPLKHICFIERSTTNSCEALSATDAINLIFNQVYMPRNPVAMAQTLSLINRMISTVKLWKIKCNMDISAAETAYNIIFKK